MKTNPGDVAPDSDADAGQSSPGDEAAQEQVALVRAVRAGLIDLEEGREMSPAEAKRRLLTPPGEAS